METMRVLLVACKGESDHTVSVGLGKQDVDSPIAVQQLLEASAYHVTRAYGVADAFEVLRVASFDLFLLDHEPAAGASACPLLDHLVNDENLCHIPAIGMCFAGKGFVLKRVGV